MINPITKQPFTATDADRLLGLADQFMEDWAIEAGDEQRDNDYDERSQEYHAIRPLLAAAPAMLAALEAQESAEADPEAGRRKGYFDEARKLRRDVLRQLGSRVVPPERKPFDFLTHGSKEGAS